MKIRFKKLVPEAKMPFRGTTLSAGCDLTATSVEKDEHGNLVYGTGLAVEIPEGYVGLLFPRSSVYKTNLRLTNSVGVIDSDYRGEIKFKYGIINRAMTLKSRLISLISSWRVQLTWVAYAKNPYKVGDRIGQLIIIPYPDIEWEEADSLTVTDRGEGGYGSTGK